MKKDDKLKDDKFPLGINGDSMEYEAIYDYAKTNIRYKRIKNHIQ